MARWHVRKFGTLALNLADSQISFRRQAESIGYGGVIWVYVVIWVYLLFRFKTDRKLKISIHDSVGVKIYAFRSSLSAVEELFDNF